MKFGHNRAFAFTEWSLVTERWVFQLTRWYIRRGATYNGIELHWWPMRPEKTIDGRTIYR